MKLSPFPLALSLSVSVIASAADSSLPPALQERLNTRNLACANAFYDSGAREFLVENPGLVIKAETYVSQRSFFLAGGVFEAALGTKMLRAASAETDEMQVVVGLPGAIIFSSAGLTSSMAGLAGRTDDALRSQEVSRKRQIDLAVGKIARTWGEILRLSPLQQEALLSEMAKVYTNEGIDDQRQGRQMIKIIENARYAKKPLITPHQAETLRELNLRFNLDRKEKAQKLSVKDAQRSVVFLETCDAFLRVIAKDKKASEWPGAPENESLLKDLADYAKLHPESGLVLAGERKKAGAKEAPAGGSAESSDKSDSNPAF